MPRRASWVVRQTSFQELYWYLLSHIGPEQRLEGQMALAIACSLSIVRTCA